MTATLLIGLVALTDIARRGRSPGVRWILAVVVWVVLGLIGVVGWGVPPIPALLAVVVAVGWMLLMPSDDGDEPRRLWPVPTLVGLIAVAMFVAGDDAGDAPLATAYRDLVGGAGAGIPFSVVIAALAITAFLTTSGNIIVRAALGRSHAQSADGTADGRRVWELRLGGLALGEVGEKPRRRPSEQSLKGGRLIGPIERLLIVALSLSGMSVLIAALVAAKGVVRFPEISEDRGVGSKAEEFLVGSLASWAVSGAASAYLTAVIYL